MEQYIGLDVSLKETFIAVRADGKRVWRGKCPSDPEIIAQTSSDASLVNLARHFARCVENANTALFQ